MHIEEALTVAITQRLPVPDHDTAFEDLVRLRNDNKAFRTALTNLLEWKRDQAREILAKPDHASEIARAIKDFDRISNDYTREMQAANYHKMATVASIFISAVTLDYAGVIKEGLVSFSEWKQPSWKKVSEMKCAPGGVVYHFKQAINWSSSVRKRPSL